LTPAVLRSRNIPQKRQVPASRSVPSALRDYLGGCSSLLIQPVASDLSGSDANTSGVSALQTLEGVVLEPCRAVRDAGRYHSAPGTPRSVDRQKLRAGSFPAGQKRKISAEFLYPSGR
jgi:hypothetical protein